MSDAAVAAKAKCACLCTKAFHDWKTLDAAMYTYIYMLCVYIIIDAVYIIIDARFSGACRIATLTEEKTLQMGFWGGQQSGKNVGC